MKIKREWKENPFKNWRKKKSNLQMERNSNLQLERKVHKESGNCEMLDN